MTSEMEQFLTKDPVFPNQAKKYFEKNSVSFIGAIEKTIPIAVGGAVAGAGIELAGRGVTGILGAISKAQNYKKMIKANPDLKEYGGDRLKRHFGILHRFGPTLAKDPTLAAGWIRTVNQYQMEGHDFIQPDTIKGLIDIEEGIATNQSNSLMGQIKTNMTEEVGKQVGKTLSKRLGGR